MGKGMPKRRVWLTVLSAALMAGLLGAVSCTSPSNDTDSLRLVFKYGVGARNELDTFNGTFTKDMILAPSIKIKLSLSEEELDRIHQKMLEINFFNYPDRFTVPVPPDGIVQMVTPHNSYYFKVEYGSKLKELWWEDKIRNENIEADRLRELIKLIWDIIESKEEYQALPPPEGGYL